MPKLPPCSRRDLIKKLHRLGFSGPFGGGKHSYMKKESYRQTLSTECNRANGKTRARRKRSIYNSYTRYCKRITIQNTNIRRKN